MLKYKKLSKYLENIYQKGAQIKSIVYAKDFPFNVGSCFSLFSTCVNNKSSFQQFKEKVEYETKVEISDKYLFYVMLAEFINTGKIVGGGKIKKLIIDNSSILNIPLKSKIIKSNVQIRVINNNLPKQILKFSEDRHIKGVYDLSYQQYSSLSKAYPQLLTGKNIIIQSKSSCLPPWLLFQNLAIKSKFDIIDCCSAPGNKTMQLAQYLGTNGRVLAFEKNEKRFNLLKSRIKKYNISNIKKFNQDFLQTDPKDARFKRVKMILADPSCSGSGMLINFQQNDPSVNQNTFEQVCKNKYARLSQEQKKRIQSLKRFQLEILTHCAKFQPLRLSYSTCSIYQQQNQEVVRQFLISHPEYRIKRRPQEINELPRGFGEIGHDCIRVSPISRKTDGFFVCIFKLKQ